MSGNEKNTEKVKEFSILLEVLEKEGIVIETGEKLVVTVIDPIVDISE